MEENNARKCLCASGKPKVRYRTPGSVMKAFKLMSRGHSKLGVYYCDVCKAWHIGHSGTPFRPRGKIDVLFERIKQERRQQGEK